MNQQILKNYENGKIVTVRKPTRRAKKLQEILDAKSVRSWRMAKLMANESQKAT
jgi:hypothetical protein